MRPIRLRFLCMAVAAILAGVPLALTEESDRPEGEPRNLGLQERADRHLVQIDVSVDGARDVLDKLRPEDFTLKVMTRVLTDFTVDRVCRQPDPATTTASEGTAAPAMTEPAATPAIRSAVVPTSVAPTTYLIYFDHAFMTLEGNNLAPPIAKELIGRLIRDGNRGLVVSSGSAVKTYSDLTDNVEALSLAVDEVFADHINWWDPTRGAEETQIAQLLEALNSRGVDEVASMARLLATEERWRAEKAFRRFSMVLGRLADLPQPKAVIYFSDRLRSNPGEHYLSYFSEARIRNSTAASTLSSVANEADYGALSYDRVVNEANANGARVYTVQAEGMTNLSVGVAVQRSSPRAAAGTRHLTDAQSTLQSMASETGGQSFIHGVKADRIAESIERDLSCIYLVSFDAAGFPRNEPLAVAIAVNGPKLKVRHRGQIYIQGDSQRLTSRLMAAFAAPDTVKSETRVAGAVIPTGYADGKYTALVQLSVEGSPLAGATWDMGMSVLARDKVREDAAERVTVSGAGTPVVLEKTMTFAPGPYEIVLVAHETQEDRIATGRLTGEFPDVSKDAAPAVGPIAVMQPAAAVFLRDGQHKTRGALAREPSDFLRTDRATAILSLVCWPQGTDGRLVVERELVGASVVPFPPIEIDAKAEVCAPILDQIPAGTMGDGEFVYSVHLKRETLELATGTRKFSAVGATPDAAPDAAPAADAGP